MISLQTPAENWQLLDAENERGLIEARLQLHYAAQVIAAIGRYLLPPKADDSHTSLEWLAGIQALASQPTGKPPTVRGALRFADLHLLLISDSGRVTAELPLSGRTPEEALGWIKGHLHQQGIEPAAMRLETPYALPAHPLGEGGRFQLHDSRPWAILSAYFSNADLLLRRIVEANSGASPVRCWPHHFDIATLITVQDDPEPEKAKSIGVGLSPGDDNYPFPYFYVTPWPYPDVSRFPLPELAGAGHWHTEGWIGAVLTADQIVSKKDPRQQAAQTGQFLESAIEAARRFLK